MAESWKLTLTARGIPSSLLMSMKREWMEELGRRGEWVTRLLGGELRPWGKDTARGGEIEG